MTDGNPDLPATEPAVSEPTVSDSEELGSFSTRRPVAVLMVFLAAVVFGAFSLSQLPVTLMPELSYPTLTVRTEYPGAAPEEVENDISRPIEEALGVIGGLTRNSSISRAGVSDVVLEFSWDTEMSDAIQDTLEKLDLVFLPAEAERPLILRFDPSLDPVLELSLSGRDQRFEGEEGLRTLRRIAELQVRRALEPIKGVAAVRIRGGLEEEIHVRVDDEKLRRTGLPIQRLIDRLRQENVNVAGGTIKEGRTEYMVRTLNEYQSLDQIADTVVARLDERDVRVRDIAEVAMSHKEREILTRTDGGESVQLDIYKEADANMVALAKAVRARLGELDTSPVTAEEAIAEAAPQKPGERPSPTAGLATQLYRTEGVVLEVVADRSIFIESSIAEVRNTALIGGLLAVVVLFLFLRNVRTTLIIAVSIPISLLVTFAPLDLLGVTLNIMSLGGLALGIGMLVDSSIVVLESIFRCKEEGDGVVTAAVRGTREVRGAVIASTFTSIAVFFPMVFVEGVAGQAFGDLGLAVVISLLVALVVAIAFIPMLASRQGLTLGETVRSPRSWLRLGSWHALRDDARGYWRWVRGTRSPAVAHLPWAEERTASGYGNSWSTGDGAAGTGMGGIVHLLLVLVSILPMAVFLVARFPLHLFAELAGKILLAVMALVLVLVTGIVRFLGRILGRLSFVWRILSPVGKIEPAYGRVLGWALDHRGAIIFFALLLFSATAWLALELDSELLPEVHQGELTVEVALPVGTPLEETDTILEPVERAILEERQHIESLLVTVGYDAANSQRSDEGEHTARFKFLLESSDPRLEEAVITRLRARFAEIPDVEARIVRPVLFSFKTPIEVEIHGDDLKDLRLWAGRVRDVMASLPELADVETTQRAGAPEVQIVYQRDLLSRYDLDIQQVAQLVRNSIKGFEATRYNLEDRRIPILVQFRNEDRSTVEDVRDLLINPGADRPIPLSTVAQVALGEGPSEVRRTDGRRVALVRANIARGSLGAAVDAIEREVRRQVDLPSDMTFVVAGQSQEWERSQSSLMLALALSIFLVYVIMAAQFESLFHPFVIMFSIPLAFFGTFLALRLFEISLSIVVFLGMIMLAGIVVNNAIVLVDYINTLKRRGLDRRQAILTACRVRLRPILMTTATTVLGLLPMALGLGDGAEIRTPMAIAVISGLLASTLLTLLIIPTLYSLVDSLPLVDRSHHDPHEDETYETLPGIDPEAAAT